MGSSSSKPELTPAQQDIKHLGDRYPFGDDELWRIYKCFQQIRGSSERVSFLSDWAVHCTSLPKEQAARDESEKILQDIKEERLMLIKVVETKILPIGFGNRLEKVAFVSSEDIIDYEEISALPADDLDKTTQMMKLEKFFNGLSNCGRHGGREAMAVLFACFAQRPSPAPPPGCSTQMEDVADVKDLLNITYRLALAAAFFQAAKRDEGDMGQFIPPDDISDAPAMKALRQSVIDYCRRKRVRESPFGEIENSESLENGFIQKMEFMEWSEANAPLLPSAMATFIHFIFFSETPYPPSRTAFDFPKLPEESAFFHSASSTMLFSFACMSSALGGSWHRLYTSSSDGLSFNRLQNSLLGYGGPTLLVIQATNGGIFGAFTASPWKESKDFYGNSDCFLYQLLPMTAVYRPSGNDVNYMYCNSEARSRGYDAQAHGIGFGGSTDLPRLFIAESFDGCIASAQDLTFDGGALLPKTPDGALQRSFEIDALEVWGVGGELVVAEALGARNKQRELTAANIRKARKVDKAAFLDDFRSGLIESKAFQHRDQMRGRADACIDESRKNGYVYEK